MIPYEGYGEIPPPDVTPAAEESFAALEEVVRPLIVTPAADASIVPEGPRKSAEPGRGLRTPAYESSELEPDSLTPPFAAGDKPPAATAEFSQDGGEHIPQKAFNRGIRLLESRGNAVISAHGETDAAGMLDIQDPIGGTAESMISARADARKAVVEVVRDRDSGTAETAIGQPHSIEFTRATLSREGFRAGAQAGVDPHTVDCSTIRDGDGGVYRMDVVITRNHAGYSESLTLRASGQEGHPPQAIYERRQPNSEQLTAQVLARYADTAQSDLYDAIVNEYPYSQALPIVTRIEADLKRLGQLAPEDKDLLTAARWLFVGVPPLVEQSRHVPPELLARFMQTMEEFEP